MGHKVNPIGLRVGINQEDPRAFLGENNRSVDASGGLSLLRKGAGDQNNFRRASQRSQQEGGTKRAVRLRHLRLGPRLGNQFHGLAGRGHGKSLGSGLKATLGAQRNHAQRRQGGDGLGLFRSAHGVVDAFQQKCQPNSGRKAEGQRESKIARHVGLRRVGGDAGLIHTADIVGP